ncbi:MAG: adenylate/guanylate cyclase domain-containing protein [Treponema sp.]|jgi:class 3 adenylate cyclase/CHASE2 domain-containing sensor protein|nr:adenylate/guanylate cyclase domain-containing protein [Treponema sp.]
MAKKQKKKIGKKPAALIITGLVFLVIMGLHTIGAFNFLEYKSYDWRVRFWAERSHTRGSDDIIVILLDDASIAWAQEERGWGWPWPREAYADIVNYMNFSNAKSLVFDVIFSEPSIYRNAKQDEIIDTVINLLEEADLETTRQARPDNQRQTRSEGGDGQSRMPPLREAIALIRSLRDRVDDARFRDASSEFGRVVQAVMFSSQTGREFQWPSDLNVPLLQTANFGSKLEQFSVGETERALLPIDYLRNTARVLGSVTGIPDSDGIIRRLKPFTLFDGNAIPGLSGASLIVAGRDLQMYYNDRNSTIEWDYINIPVDKNGNAILRYRGTLDDNYIIKNAMSVLQSIEAVRNGEEPILSPELFVDAYVFFGFYAEGLYDIFNTPIAAFYPGMGCHITMLDNMLMNDFIRQSTGSFNVIILLTVIIVTVILTMFVNRILLSVGGMVILVFVIIVSSFIFYESGGLWVPMITFIAGTATAFITVTLYNYATEGSQKRFIKSAFSQYLSPKVIEQIIQDPSQLKLGGEKREMTAVFTDVRAFSTFSEALGDPAKLVELLNFYLTRMSDIILDNQGTIDKYVGDAIIGFFGAPIYMKNHASLACHSAIKMKKAELEINREALERELVTPKVMEALAAKGKIRGLDDPCPVYTRLGINTGDMVVGNMGTPNKMDYTIMGNAVNLAARLEGVNDQYNTSGILISEYTREHLGDEFVLRPLSRVRVVGINTPLRLYELLDVAAEAAPELIDMVKSWENAFGFYEKRDFLAAQNIFQTIISKNVTIYGHPDMVAKKYLDRCAKYLSSPPDEKAWDDGVDNLTSK